MNASSSINKLISDRETDFVNAVNKALRRKTAIDFSQMQLTRIGCSAFIVSTDGHIKVFSTAQDQISRGILLTLLQTAA